MSISYTLGAELEFYIFGPEDEVIADLSSGKFPQKRYATIERFALKLRAFVDELTGRGYSISAESGPGQYEVQFGPLSEAEVLAAKLNDFRRDSQKIAAAHGFQSSFAAKPLADHCGNGLHIHYCSNLFDPYGLVANNGAMQQKNDVENKYVLWAIGGMLANIPTHSALFFPQRESHARLVPYLNAPTKICWGRNNRSCAIRVPDSKPKRIEHRVAGADADPLSVINAVIADAQYGIKNQITPGGPIFGNAWDQQYKLPLIV